MAIAITSPQADTWGFIKNCTSANASGGEVILAGTAGTKIKVKHLTMNNLTAGALSFTLEDEGTALIGPVSIGANSSLQWDFNPMMALRTDKDLEITADSGNVCIFVTGVQE